ncbi:ABC transporter ATP-binding protein [Qipengyuania sp. JC766]|uniref:ABC transporter ATP-binding protein n=1 Tax=Qipengyuania sp. JC766 TaxID=3232139 RepID=UPI003459AD9A
MTGAELGTQGVSIPGRLTDVSVMLEAGSVTAICGPNGAGKSTLLSVLAGLNDPASGRAMLGETPLSALDPRQRAQRIGFLPQEPDIAWDLAVRNLVSLGRLPHRDRATGLVDNALAALDLVGFADRPVSTLSGGERARVLLARVLAGEPEWILADEPLAALDLAHQAQLVGHLKAVARKGAGVVIVLHDLALARNHADRVILLSEGRIHSEGEPATSLSPAGIAEVFGVEGEWLGEEGRLAFSPVLHTERLPRT